jgi:hypothetical protein
VTRDDRFFYFTLCAHLIENTGDTVSLERATRAGTGQHAAGINCRQGFITPTPPSVFPLNSSKMEYFSPGQEYANNVQHSSWDILYTNILPQIFKLQHSYHYAICFGCFYNSVCFWCFFTLIFLIECSLWRNCLLGIILYTSNSSLDIL